MARLKNQQRRANVDVTRFEQSLVKLRKTVLSSIARTCRVREVLHTIQQLAVYLHSIVLAVA